MCAFTLHHAGSERAVKDKAQGLLARLAADLPPALAEAEEDKGKALRLEEVMADLLLTR